ncbi:MAG: SDR family oxidoreductase, partial [Lachnospiraceae bacterium]|nr:SDR family oxidoreductase [Lachnospiraceae bacterium]
MKNVYGNRVLVTGASSGIGEACARMFAENGCFVTGVSRHCKEETRKLPGGGSLAAKRLDVTDEEAVRAFAASEG